MKKKLIIFDMDGVLLDSTKVVSDYFVDLHPKITPTVMDELLCGNFHEELDKFQAIHGPVVEPDEKYEIFRNKKDSSPFFPGIPELLRSLHSKGYVLAINTSAGEEGCLRVLKNGGIFELFDFIAHAEVSKSKVEKFKILEKKYKIPKTDTIFVTDTLGDLREAEISGIPTVAVTYGQHDRSYFEKEEHKNLVAIVDTVEELGQIISV